jgi:hypothetical protein
MVIFIVFFISTTIVSNATVNVTNENKNNKNKIMLTIDEEDRNDFFVGDFCDNTFYNMNIDEYQYIEREQIIDIAEGFLNHQWQPTNENIFHDTYKGWHVDTPDRDTYSSQPSNWGWKANQMNAVIPYKWGGFSSISGFNLTNPEDFDEQYTGTGNYEGTIHFGGDIYTDKNFVCQVACGVDCSGFVSRCWNLPIKHGTYTLPYASSQIKYHELETGDVLNIPHYHVILFVEFLNNEKTLIRTIEAGGGYPNVNEHIYTILSVSDDDFYVTLAGYPLDREFGLYRYNYIAQTPFPPIIDGPTSGKIKENYSYTISTIDPEEDDIYYCIDWGDGNYEGWSGPYSSGTEIALSHQWDKEGTFPIRVKSKDTNEHQSGWCDPLEVNMPKSKINSPLLKLIKNHTALPTLLRCILG